MFRIYYTLAILSYLGARNTAATHFHALRRRGRYDPIRKLRYSVRRGTGNYFCINTYVNV